MNTNEYTQLLHLKFYTRFTNIYKVFYVICSSDLSVKNTSNYSKKRINFPAESTYGINLYVGPGQTVIFGR